MHTATRRPAEPDWIAPLTAALHRLVPAARGDNTAAGSEAGAPKPSPAAAATLARLRRGLGTKPAERDIWVWANVNPAPKHEEEETAMLVASLFALWHQGSRRAKSAPARSLGGAMRALAADERKKAAGRGGVKGSESDAVAAIDRRFAALLDSHRDDVPNRLRQVVLQLRGAEVPIDWRQLAIDLVYWDSEGRGVQRKWARDYWTGTATSAENAENSSPTGPGGDHPVAHDKESDL